MCKSNVFFLLWSWELFGLPFYIENSLFDEFLWKIIDLIIRNKTPYFFKQFPNMNHNRRTKTYLFLLKMNPFTISTKMKALIRFPKFFNSNPMVWRSVGHVTVIEDKGRIDIVSRSWLDREGNCFLWKSSLIELHFDWSISIIEMFDSDYQLIVWVLFNWRNSNH